jgi:hypothetical protein
MYIYTRLEMGKQTIYSKQTEGPKSQTFKDFKTSVDSLYGIAYRVELIRR